MLAEDIEKLEKTLEERGYKQIGCCKVTENDDYEWYKAFRDENGELKYQIFFEIWDFRKYGAEHIGVSVTVTPDFRISLCYEGFPVRDFLPEEGQFREGVAAFAAVFLQLAVDQCNFLFKTGLFVFAALDVLRQNP